jgi:hypothetical protein
MDRSNELSGVVVDADAERECVVSPVQGREQRPGERTGPLRRHLALRATAPLSADAGGSVEDNGTQLAQHITHSADDTKSTRRVGIKPVRRDGVGHGGDGGNEGLDARQQMHGA